MVQYFTSTQWILCTCQHNIMLSLKAFQTEQNVHIASSQGTPKLSVTSSSVKWERAWQCFANFSTNYILNVLCVWRSPPPPLNRHVWQVLSLFSLCWAPVCPDNYSILMPLTRNNTSPSPTFPYYKWALQVSYIKVKTMKSGPFLPVHTYTMCYCATASCETKNPKILYSTLMTV